jgi:hypothetical protein
MVRGRDVASVAISTFGAASLARFKVTDEVKADARASRVA